MTGSIPFGALLRIIVVLVLAGAAIALVDVRVFDLAWSGRALSAIALVQIPVLVVTWLGAFRLAMLVRAPRIAVWPAFKALVLANGLNLVLPSHLGEFAKPSYLRDHQSIPLSEGLGAVVIERATDILALAVLTLAGFSLLLMHPNATIFFMAGAVVLVFAALPRLSGVMPRLILLLPWRALREFSSRMLEHVVRKLKDRAIYMALAVAVLQWVGCWLYTAWFLQLAGGRPLDWSGGLVLLLATTVGAAVPALPGGFGTYEAAAVAVLKSLGYGFEEALVIGVALHVSQLIVGSVGAVAVMAVEHIGIGSLVTELREIARLRKRNAAP